MIAKFFQLFFKKLRLSNPWRFKAPFLISVPYFFILVGEISWEIALLNILASISTIFGIAGFGYLTNDLSDIEKDRAIGKENLASEISKGQVAMLMAFFLVAAIGPWFYFPVNQYSLGLLGAEFVLFLVYAFPPFRFKERGWLGILTDALYAHANPAVLAGLTFYLVGGAKYGRLELFLGSVFAWQFLLGIRNILLHQLKDLQDDQTSGTKTLVAGSSERRIRIFLTWVLVPLEVSALMLFLAVVGVEIPWLVPGMMLFLAYTLFRQHFLWKKPFPQDVRGSLYLYLDPFYTKWFPVMVILSLVGLSWWFLVLLGVHVLLFENAVVEVFKDLRDHV